LTYCPEIGKTNWKTAIPQVDGEAYVGQLESNGVYQCAYSQVAVNILLVEWYPGAQWPSPRVGAVQGVGQIATWQRPAELVMLVGDSTWDVGSPSTSLGVGNTGVWPYSPVANSCTNLGGPAGWTWYIHRGTTRDGLPAPTGNEGINSGRANVAFGDGHVKAVNHASLESCDFNTAKGLWVWTHWDPRY
jgi:prepilin-type processing-associated H-X9-DG protein